MADDNTMLINPHTDIKDVTINQAKSTNTRRYFDLVGEKGVVMVSTWVSTGRWQTANSTDEMLRRMRHVVGPLDDLMAEGEKLRGVLGAYQGLNGLTEKDKAELLNIAKMFEDYKKKLQDAGRLNIWECLMDVEVSSKKKSYIADAKGHAGDGIRALQLLIAIQGQAAYKLDPGRVTSDLKALEKSKHLIELWAAGFVWNIFH